MISSGRKKKKVKKEEMKALNNCKGFCEVKLSKVIIIVLLLLVLGSFTFASSPKMYKVNLEGNFGFTSREILDSDYIVASNQIFYGSDVGTVDVTVYLTAPSGAYKIGLETSGKLISVDAIRINNARIPINGERSNKFKHNANFPLNQGVSEVTFELSFTPGEIGLLEKFDVILYKPNGDELIRLDPFLSAFTFRRSIAITNDSAIDVDANYPIDLNVNDWDFQECVAIGDCREDGKDVIIVYNDVNIARSIEAEDNNKIWFELQQPLPSGSTDDENYFVYYGISDAVAPVLTTNFLAPALDYNAIGDLNETGVLLHFENDLNDSSRYKRDANAAGSWSGFSDSNVQYGQLGAGGFSDSDYINLPSGSFNYPRGTLEFFFRDPLLDTAADVSSPFGTELAGARRLEIQIKGSGAVAPFINEIHVLDVGDGALNHTCGPIVADQWYHFALTWDGEDVNMYLNGSDCNSLVDNWTMVGDLAFIGRLTVATVPFLGAMDEFRISTYARRSFPTASFPNQVNFVKVVGFEEVEAGVITSFNFISTPSFLDPENGINSVIVDFNDTSRYFEVIPDSFSWDENGVQFSTDQNSSRTYSSVGDFNISYTVDVNNSTNDTDWQVISIKQVPQDVDFTFNIVEYRENGVDVNFIGSAITDGDNILYWWEEDGNFFSTDASGVHTLVNADVNTFICLTVNDNDANKTTCKSFQTTKVLLKKPLDEEELFELTPFDVSVNSGPDQNYTGFSVDFNFMIFTNTFPILIVAIDFNTSYFDRGYDVNADGTFQEIQPYLINSANGISVTLFSKLFSNFSTFENLRVQSFKDIGGSDTLVESVITDSKGEALMSFIVNDTYKLRAFLPSGEFLVESEIVATNNQLFAYVDIATITIGLPVTRSTIVLFRPRAGRVLAGTVLEQEVTYNTGTATMIRIIYENNDVNILDHNFTSSIGSGFSTTLTVSDLNADANFVIRVTVIVQFNDGSEFIATTTYSIPLPRRDVLQLFLDIRADFGCSTDPASPCFFTMLVSFFIALAACVAIFLKLGGFNVKGIALIFMIVIGLFTYIGWFHGLLFAIMFVGAIAGLVVNSRRED